MYIMSVFYKLCMYYMYIDMYIMYIFHRLFNQSFNFIQPI